MGSLVTDIPKLHRETPCIRSTELSRAAGCNVYLKLENLQPSGSFKSRGIGALMARAVLGSVSVSGSSGSGSGSGSGRAHFYCSSGGNAGLACAEAARALRRPCDVFVWSLTPDHVLDRLSALGATPHRAGSGWPEADAFCRAAAAADPDGVYVPPFDHPLIWEGNATLVDELAALEAEGFFFDDDNSSNNGDDGSAGAVDAIVCNVGGGGLLNGVMEGIERNYYGRPRRPAVLALETAGADSLAASVRAGAHVTIPAVTSVASSLGAPRVAERTYRWAEACGAGTFSYDDPATAAAAAAAVAHPDTTTRLASAIVSDADAVSACARFADDAHLLVEVACGATLAGIYSDGGARLRAALFPGADDARWARANVVLVVCGGSNISVDMLAKYRAKFGV